MPNQMHFPPDVLRLRAGNPSPLTGTGSNSYLLRGAGGAVLVDAGPALPAHVAQILAALQGAPLQAILITHPHLDHSGAAPALAAATGAVIYSFGPAARHRSASQDGADFTHHPDVHLAEGQITLAGLDITVVHTPGHMQGHLCFGLRDMLFSGDHVMGWASSLVASPEGDMAAYRASLRRLQGAGFRHYFPGHGEGIADPEARLADLIAHRNLREAQIIAALGAGPLGAADLARNIYTGLPQPLLTAAAQNVLAHLIELAAMGRAHCKGPADIHAPFTLS